MPKTSDVSKGIELDKVTAARAAARERFERFADDEGGPSGIVDPDNPPMTDDQLARLRPAHEVHAGLVAISRQRKAGRPKKATPKKAVSIRLDLDVIEALKADSEGWQTRANEMLRKALGLGLAA